MTACRSSRGGTNLHLQPHVRLADDFLGCENTVNSIKTDAEGHGFEAVDDANVTPELELVYLAGWFRSGQR